MKQPSIGQLRQRLVLLEPIRTPEPGGGASIEWRELARVWGMAAPIRGREVFRHHRIAAEADYLFVIRHRRDVTASMRLLHRGKTYRIEAVLDDEGWRRWLRLYCVQRN